MKVLIVDDSLLAEHAIKSYFDKLGYSEIYLAKNGEIAKEMYSELNPDIITVDAVMPGISGVDFIKYVNQKRPDNSKIIMISSDELPNEDKSRIRVDKYLIKQFRKLNSFA